MTEEMSGGLRHHCDEASGPELCGWIKKSTKKVITLPKQAVHMPLKGEVCPDFKKNNTESLTAPASLEMLKKSRFA